MCFSKRNYRSRFKGFLKVEVAESMSSEVLLLPLPAPTPTLTTPTTPTPPPLLLLLLREWRGELHGVGDPERELVDRWCDDSSLLTSPSLLELVIIGAPIRPIPVLLFIIDINNQSIKHKSRNQSHSMT